MGTITALEQLYLNLKTENYEPIDMHHSSVHYILAALRDSSVVPERVAQAAQELDLDQLYELLKEEGLLPAYEYGIPKWYAQKWFPEERKRKERADRKKAEKKQTAENHEQRRV